MLVTSLIRRNGSFQDAETKRTINYDNLVFGCVADNPNYIFGKEFKQVKIKYNDFMASYKGSLAQLEGKDVTFFFDADSHYIGCQVK